RRAASPRLAAAAAYAGTRGRDQAAQADRRQIRHVTVDDAALIVVRVDADFPLLTAAHARAHRAIVEARRPPAEIGVRARQHEPLARESGAGEELEAPLRRWRRRRPRPPTDRAKRRDHVVQIATDQVRLAAGERLTPARVVAARAHLPHFARRDDEA